jgi:hypothetical protein
MERSVALRNHARGMGLDGFHHRRKPVRAGGGKMLAQPDRIDEDGSVSRISRALCPE